MTTAVRNMQYGEAGVRDFHIVGQNEGKVDLVEVNGTRAIPTQRFWTSLCANYSTYGLSLKLFKLYSHAEVFTRLTDVLGAGGKHRLCYTVEQGEDGRNLLLAVRNPTSPLLEYESARELVSRFAVAGLGGDDKEVDYKEGVLQSRHRPPNMDDVTIGGDQFRYQYITETPIDGYGKPVNYLMLQRLVCNNGAVGYARTFRSEIPLGKADDNPMHALERCLQSFNNEEGFSALRGRFDAATKSWASVNEANMVWSTISRMVKQNVFHAAEGQTNTAKLAAKWTAAKAMDQEMSDNHTNIMLGRAFLELTGDICSMYEMASMSAMTNRRQRMSPVRCTMYDLINFATEVATHYANPREALQLQALVGTFVSEEYDLEGSSQLRPSFQDWFTDIKRSDRLNPDVIGNN